ALCEAYLMLILFLLVGGVIFAGPGQSEESCGGSGGGGEERGGKMMCLVLWFAVFVRGVVRVIPGALASRRRPLKLGNDYSKLRSQSVKSTRKARIRTTM